MMYSHQIQTQPAYLDDVVEASQNSAPRGAFQIVLRSRRTTAKDIWRQRFKMGLIPWVPPFDETKLNHSVIVPNPDNVLRKLRANLFIDKNGRLFLRIAIRVRGFRQYQFVYCSSDDINGDDAEKLVPLEQDNLVPLEEVPVSEVYSSSDLWSTHSCDSDLHAFFPVITGKINRHYAG